jgi:NodT family efflux transporter outer membrane factor (OMF) lipoprotein
MMSQSFKRAFAKDNGHTLSRACKSFVLLLLACLSGCTSLSEYVRNGFKVGPNYSPPPATIAPQWIDSADRRVRSESDDLSQWWKVFNDPVLDDLVCHAYRQNLTLREAGFRVLQARAENAITIGEIFPQSQNITGGYSRNATSIAQLLGGSFGSFADGGVAPSIRRYFNQNTVNFGLAWELDFWGRYRRAIEASSADLDASVANYEDVLVTLLGDVAVNYVQFRVLEQQIELLNENARLQRDTLKFVKDRFDAGAKDSELDYPQAQTTYSQTLAQIPPTEARLRVRTNRLSVLLGIPPEDLQKRLEKKSIPSAPTDVITGIPTELLRRRPDVRRAERFAAAESARIGVAESQLYPHISISGTFGWQAPKLDQLFTKPAFQGSYGPSFQWDVLNYGRLLNTVRFQRARFEEVVTVYQNQVLVAAEEVENGVTVFLKSQDQVKHLADSVKAAQKARDVGELQYKAGKIDFNRQSVLELNLVNQQNLLAQARGDVALGLIEVYRALGGGWQMRCNGCDSPGDFPPISTISGRVPAAPVSLPNMEETPPATQVGAQLGMPRPASTEK